MSGQRPRNLVSAEQYFAALLMLMPKSFAACASGVLVTWSEVRRASS